MSPPNIYKIPEELMKEAIDYAMVSKEYTSNRHDFHEGGLDAKKRKMLEGKMGEKIFKLFLIKNKITFKEDQTDFTLPDTYDFILPSGLLIDVKTRTKDYHIRTLEMKEQFENKPKDVYVSVRLFPEEEKGFIVGWTTKEDIIKINRIENHGYLDNYVLYDKELRPIDGLIKLINNSSCSF